MVGIRIHHRKPVMDHKLLGLLGNWRTLDNQPVMDHSRWLFLDCTPMGPWVQRLRWSVRWKLG